MWEALQLIAYVLAFISIALRGVSIAITTAKKYGDNRRDLASDNSQSKNGTDSSTGDSRDGRGDSL